MNQITCNKCKIIQDENCFVFKNKVKNKRQTICKTCQNVYKLKWYYKNHEENRVKFNQTRQNLVISLQEKMIEYLTGKCCIDCGESNIITLDFDHINPEEKQHNIGNMIHSCFSWEKICEEINKCEIRCANCHRIKTAKTYSYYKHSDSIGR
jgi:hypothetical protein